ncbi:Uncharacterised protein [Anaerotruncus sp. 2789STDY5834896]|uniref:Uncharacterized protein n=1 Tax=uncultured Anaerotruncus sp. TaxID=905011 RepID=A0A1C6KB45_9FIRM|nr:Uncharacterised protein [uncultured Anaerotruncus sp.]
MLGGSFLYGWRWSGDSPALKGQMDPQLVCGRGSSGAGPDSR